MKIRALNIPDGCEILEFRNEEKRKAYTLFRKMVESGYKSRGTHTNNLKPGTVQFFRHDGSYWVTWIKPLVPLDAHVHRMEKRKDGSEREFAMKANGNFIFKSGGRFRRCVDCEVVA